ncbi:HEPN domain-containing protein [Candidatus Gracilibacteria bacterium]|nr:HEPN domain-containing protein [Candidatus Gracilibacteria bacterium]
MKTDISHIPKHKREEIEKVVSIIQSTQYKDMGAEMVILYGSYARGDFVVRDVVREGGNTRVYESDIDIFVVTKKPTQEKNIRLAREIEQKIRSNTEIESHFNIIMEDIFHVNKMLKESRYLYVDIKSEGVLLYDSKKYTLAESEELPKEYRKKIQQEDFDLWFPDADVFFNISQNMYKQGDYKIGAFQMHQATERYITAYLLVKTGYKPKTHDLEILYEKVTELESSLYIFDMTDKEDKYHFELLKKAYIEARYSKEYSVTGDELLFLSDKILSLKNIIQNLCQQEIGN